MSPPIERNGSLVRRYHSQGGRLVSRDSEQEISTFKLLRSMFMPEGFPQSVSSDYLRYQIFDSSQAFCSSIAGQLSTQSVLRAIGVGNELATPMAATLTWMARDGVGMTGRILFAWGFARQLDSNPKGWRLVADVFNDAAMLLEIAAGTHGWQNAWPILCFTSVLRAVVGVAGGASRAALTQHQARRNNMADVAAKDGSQETAVNLLALIIGLFLIPWINMDPLSVWAVFLAATFFHILSNYMAVTSVTMETVNNQRLWILVDHYLNTRQLLAPRQVASKESLFDFGPAPTLGVSIHRLAATTEEWETLAATFSGQGFYLSSASTTPASAAVEVSFAEGATTRDFLKGSFEAHVLLRAPRDRPPYILKSVVPENLPPQPRQRDLVIHQALEDERVFEDFEAKATAAGWNLNHVYLSIAEWRVSDSRKEK